MPTDAQILAGVQADINAAFGGNLNPSLETPQGQLATSETAIIADKNAQIALLVNQVDPNFAAGRMQDAIGNLYDMTRIPGAGTLLQVSCSGLINTVIPAFSIVVDGSGNQYASTIAGTIPASGSITIPFACTAFGPTPVPSSLTIYQEINGWDSATPASGVLGNLTETRAQFELRRQQSVAANSLQMIQSIQGNVLAVPGVIDAYSYDNAGAAATVGGVALNANSIFVCVSGGNSSAVAQAIWQKKGGGCGYTGNTTVTVQDTNSGYSTPYPSYSVTYETAISLPFLLAVNMANSAQVPSNALTLIQDAVQLAFAGNDGGSRARIGSQVFASRFYSGIAALGAWAQIRDILIGSTNTTSAVIVGSISGNTLTVGSVTSGAIAIGQSLFDTTGGIVPGTTITGGSGTSWTLSNSMTVASETITLCVAASTSQQANINQIPTLQSSNIVLTLS
ncbi:MAG: baseplate J/gp47 family protein [Thiobacillus sp.]